MKLIVAQEILDKFNPIIAVVVAKNIDNTGPNEEIIDMLKAEQKRIKELAADTLSESPKIDAWRKAYSSFGAKPKKYRSSVENLYKMILEGIELKHISKIVDIYNYISLKHLVPAGGDDIDKVDGNIVLKIASGNEPFTALNSEETKNPKQGEVVYSDDKEILCRRWNWRECNKSKMTENTKNTLLVIEGLPPVTINEVENAAKELTELIKKFCGGNITYHILNADKKEIEF